MQVTQAICISFNYSRLLFKPVLVTFLDCKILFFVWTRYLYSMNTVGVHCVALETGQGGTGSCCIVHSSI